MREKREWTLLFYEFPGGECPVRSFIDALKVNEQAKVLAWLNALKQEGIHLHRPFTDLLKDGIHELRIQISGNQIRALYFFCYRDFIVLTHTFVKRTTQVPDKEIVKAKKYRTDFISRYDTYEKVRRLAQDEL
jgi:phage-related protein